MEKKPIFGRLALVVAVTLVALFQWYPNTGGQDMVEVFEEELAREKARERQVMQQHQAARKHNKTQTQRANVTAWV